MSMEFNPGDVNDIDQASIETTGPQYPMVQWHYGDSKAKKIGGMDYQGGWFIKADQLDEATLLAAGWQKTSWTHDNGGEEEGFWRREIKVSVIAQRKRWEVISDAARQYYAWGKYDDAKAAGKASGRTHVLCLIQGLEACGPCVLTLKGMAAVFFEGNRQNSGALTRFAQTVITAANKASELAGSKARWPYRAFWLTVGAERNNQDEPLFTEVGKDKATTRVVKPVALGLPAKAELVNLGDFYVGKQLLVTVNELWSANQDWSHAWDAIAPAVEATANGADAAAATNNAVAQDKAVLEEMGL